MIINGILFLLLCFRFFRILIKMKQPAVFPVTEEDLKATRIQPKITVELPIISRQKTGLLKMGIVLLLLFSLMVIDLFSKSIALPYAIVIILALFNFNQFWNLFAIVEDGVLCGGRVVPWKSIQSYQFEQIDMNHHFYRDSPEVNIGYELWIITKYSEVSCIVTSEAVKEKLTGILDAHLSIK